MHKPYLIPRKVSQEVQAYQAKIWGILCLYMSFWTTSCPFFTHTRANFEPNMKSILSTV